MKRLSHYTIVFVMLFFISINTVFAKTSIGASLASNTKELKIGQELTVTLKLDNYVEIEKGVNAYKATLDYDKNIFEEVYIDNFTNLNKWEQLEYNRKTGEFVAIKKAGSKTPENVVKITLKVKDTSYYGKTNIKLKDITTSEGKRDLKIDDKIISVDIVKEQTSIPNNNQGSGTTNQPASKVPTVKRKYGVIIVNKNNESNDNIIEDPNISEEKDSTTNDDEVLEYYRDKVEDEREIEHTKSTYIWAFLVIVIEIIFFIIFLIWKRQKDDEDDNKDDNNKRNKKIAILVVTSIILMQFCGTVFAASYDFSKKGEVNGDSKIDYEDVRLIELHLIHSRNLLDEYLENGDINSDGKITVTDLTLLVQKLEKSLDYNVILSNSNLDNYYPNKNNDITLKFIGEVDYGALIEKVVINNKEYNVEKSKDKTNEYLLKVNTGDLAGIKEYNFTEVLLDNEKRVKVDYSIKVDVLKEVPTIENYKISENSKESKINIAFDVLDKDNSITSAIIKITDENSKVIKEKEIKKGANKIEVDVDDEKKYKANIIISYDLATNTLDKEENHTGNIYAEKDLQLIINYDFKLTNIKTYKNNIENQTFEKEEKIELRFDSTNITKFIPVTAKINGKNYNIEKRDNTYIVLVDGLNKLSSQKIEVEEVILNNGKKFAIKENNSVSVNIIKRYPTVKDIILNENIENNNMTVKFNLENKDDAIKNAHIILYNAEGVELDRKELTKEELKNKGDITKILTTKITSSYKVKLITTINQTGEDKDDQPNKILFEEATKASPRTKITKISVNKEYVEKAEKVTLTYNIESNKLENITKIRVNDLDCIATKKDKNTYEVTLEVGDKSGIYKLTTTKLVYSDNVEDNVKEEVKIDILKDKPVVKNFKQTDNTNDSEVTISFDLEDNDNSFISGKAILTDGVKTVEKELKKGANTLKFTVENAKEYTLELKATYDRDSNTLEGKPENDNLINNEVLETKKIVLISDYKLQLDDIKTHNDKTDTKYFNKNESIKISFTSTNISSFEPVSAIINGKTYNINKAQNRYTTEVSGYENSGVKELKIEKITLSNTKEISISNNNKTNIEVLKDSPKVEKFTYLENDDSTITATFTIIDNDNSLKDGTIKIYDENKKELKTEALTKKENKITFNKTMSEFYTIKVLANYDLDTNHFGPGDNEYKNQVLLDDEINVNDRLIEMKDIIGIVLYKQTGSKVEKLYKVSVEELVNLKDYIVEVKMKDLKSFYSPIREVKTVDGKLKFILEYENIVQYKGMQKQNHLEVEFGGISEGAYTNIDLATLIELIKNNPKGTYKINSDMDAKNFTSGTAVIPTEFSGTIDFDGHIIKNLSIPLFNKLNEATIKNLIIKDAKVNANGVFANTITTSTITNVHLKDITVQSPNANGTGALAGRVEQNSLIENSSATGVNVGNGKRTGGFIGQAYLSTIRNCYIEGKVSSNSDGSGGFIGEVPSTLVTLENIYVNVKTTFGGGTNAGLVGWSRNLTLKNTISLATNTTDNGPYAVYGSILNGSSSTNNYELETTNMKSQANHAKISKVSLETLKTKEFYTKTLGWDEKIWNFNNVSKGEYPTLKSNPYTGEAEEPSNEDIYIPEYSRISKLKNYDKNREIIYYNMYRLMPFYDAKYYVEDGNRIDINHVLNTKIIKKIFTYDRDGKQVVGLSKTDKDKIKSIRIVFTDNESVSYSVQWLKNTDSITTYHINDIDIDYMYEKYLIDTNSNIYKYIVNQVKTYDYVNDIASLTPETEVRNYTENYAHVIENAEKFALYLLANTEGYNISSINNVLENKLTIDLSTNNTLQKFLYGYNYFDRFYNFEIGGLNIRDIVYFDGSIFHENLNPAYLSGVLVDRASSSQRSTANLTAFFNSYIKPYTEGKSVGPFLEYFIQNLTIDKYKNDPASWIIDNYDGTIYESPAPRHKNLRYKVWDHLKSRDLLILPLLSYHGKDMYILGIPTCILVGNLDESYYFPNKVFNNLTKEEKLVPLINFANKATAFYDSIAGIVNEGGYRNLTRTMINYDNTGNKNWSTTPNPPKPAYKGFFEVLGKYTVHGAAAAYANGTDIYWIYHALAFYNIYTHEALHNQDGNTFLEGTGRRKGAGAEHFTDNFLTQANGIINSGYGVVPNYTFTNPITSATTTNLSKDRINTRKKIESYYKGMYDTFAYLDYIEAQAFLKLTPEEQSKIAQAIENQQYVKKTAEDFKKMNLKTIEDIWDNHLVIIRGGKAYTTGSMWYLSSVPSGASGKGFFVLNAYQMLADFGYDGYVAYAGNKYSNKSEEQILQMLSGDDKMTFKKYQLGRYNKVAEKIDGFKHINTKDAIEKTLIAMKLDVAHNKPIDLNSYASIYRETLYGYLKRVTNDFETSIYSNAPNLIHINSAEDFVKKVKDNPEVNIILDKDIDFTNIKTEETDQSIIETFVGSLDGNNHKITGLSKPLFNKIMFGYVKNIKIENSNVIIDYNTSGTLAKQIDFSILENIKLNNVSIKGTSVVGGLVGSINRTTVKDITYKVNVTSTTNPNELGGLFGRATYSYIENAHGIDSTIKGNNNIGGLVGNANNIHKIDKCSFNGSIVGVNNVGGLIGYFQNSTIENSYTLGEVEGTSSYIGGLIGVVSSSIVNNTFSNATVKGNRLARTGGLLGTVSNISNGRTNSKVEDSIAFGKVSNGYKFDAETNKEVIESSFNNNYELTDSLGMSSIDRVGINFNNRISKIKLSSLNSSFYTKTLDWSSSIWDFSNVTKGGLPKLKGLDKNNVETIVSKIKISSINDFLKIDEKPDAIYTLTKDLDFASYTIPADKTSVLTEIFTGKIEGNGHTISNLTNGSLFTHFRGVVEDLNIKNFQNNRPNTDFVNAFTKESYGATFNNMKFENITLSGKGNVAPVSGMDGRSGANSIFNRISVINANVVGTGFYNSAFVGRKFGGKITNVYVQGNLEFYTTENGGITGASQENVLIENVISNVNVSRPKSTDSRNINGGFVGNIYDNPTIRNSISMGNMSGTPTNVNKFTAAVGNISKLTNCYEYASATGITNVNGTNLKNATRENLRSKAFYKDTLKFDDKIWNLDKVATNGHPELR